MKERVRIQRRRMEQDDEDEDEDEDERGKRRDEKRGKAVQKGEKNFFFFFCPLAHDNQRHQEKGQRHGETATLEGAILTHCHYFCRTLTVCRDHGRSSSPSSSLRVMSGPGNRRQDTSSNTWVSRSRGSSLNAMYGGEERPRARAVWE